ncbi:MAG: iron-sulfur cluster carrier protein ApbC [Burkholderiaceae bacterium]|jgi:ATP-binding protein involved in chromosome partitioning|nr:iron-sulfur cluster carrier protein ApbC [Burkholderiaceae bacterium]
MPIDSPALAAALDTALAGQLQMLGAPADTFLKIAAIRNLRVTGDAVSFTAELGFPAARAAHDLQAALKTAACAVPGVARASAQIESRIRTHATQRGVALLPGVKNVIAVASGKGGVGKSTVAANLALALAQEGARVGLLDADIYGPSLPVMMGARGKPESLDGESIEPLVRHGVQLMSIGFLIDDADQAMIWRAPMAVQALDQLLRQTHWQDVDYLIVDTPPGTGDIQLSLAQRAPVTGAVIVTTPQDLALADARKGVTLFQKVGVPILGLVENMAVHVCSQCGHAEHIFGEDGGQRYAAEKHLPYLGALPLALAIRQQTDSGTPTVAAEPEGSHAQAYRAIARRVAIEIAAYPQDHSGRIGGIKVATEQG